MAFQSPNFTPIPNDFFDMAPDMTEAEMRVTLFLMRHTFGYHREVVRMSIEKVMAGTRMSKHGVRDGASAAEERDTIARSVDDGVTLWIVRVEDGARVPTGTPPSTLGDPGGVLKETPLQSSKEKNSIECPPPPKALTPQQDMVLALAQVMGIDDHLNGARLARLAAEIAKLGGTPDLIRKKYSLGGWYWSNNWRGQRGERPNETAIRESWNQWDAEPIEHKYAEDW